MHVALYLLFEAVRLVLILAAAIGLFTLLGYWSEILHAEMCRRGWWDL